MNLSNGSLHWNSTYIDKTLRNGRIQIYRPSADSYFAGGPNPQSTGQMLPVLHKDFAMIKEKLNNECMEKSSL